jgi:hypothetical protein
MEDFDTTKDDDADIDSNTIKHVNEFMNDHDALSPDALEKLAAEGTPEAWERLRVLADEYDIIVDDSTDPQEIIQKIRQAMDSMDEPDGGVI